MRVFLSLFSIRGDSCHSRQSGLAQRPPVAIPCEWCDSVTLRGNQRTVRIVDRCRCRFFAYWLLWRYVRLLRFITKQNALCSQARPKHFNVKAPVLKISALLSRSFPCQVGNQAFGRERFLIHLWVCLDEAVLNKISCFQANGTKEDLVDVQHTLPDVTSFEVISPIACWGSFREKKRVRCRRTWAQLNGVELNVRCTKVSTK